MTRVKHSVAVLISRGDKVLAIRRPDDEEELPGIWGLPAGTCLSGETVTDVIRRVGREKLRVSLTPVRKLASGTQDRPGYRLDMELWEVGMEGTPGHPQWQWASLELLRPGMLAGSLCCELAVRRSEGDP
jgi:8-oxo-dGTP diphosphatase